MSGIYIHIPFCLSKCNYCDFYSLPDISRKDSVVEAIVKELELRKRYLSNEKVETIYFGGGTPSLLDKHHFEKIVSTIKSNYTLIDDIEFTIEANPNDISESFISDIVEVGVNRLSIGIQSFSEKILTFLGRRHSAEESQQSVKIAYEGGIKSISIDLIYGIPGLDNGEWGRALEIATSLPVNHISAYHLTYHKGTDLFDSLKRGVFKEIDSDDSLIQFKLLKERLDSSNFNMYEISNFCKDKSYSKHNSSYWKGKSYLGIGPSAHSFNGESRGWNISSIDRYCSCFINSDVDKVVDNFISDVYKIEQLSENDKYNDYIITALRTIWGVDISYIICNFGAKYGDIFKRSIVRQVELGYIVKRGTIYNLSEKAIFISDSILLELFYME